MWDARNITSIFNVKDSSHVILKNIVFANGNGINGSAVNVDSSFTVEIINCTFINNAAADFGGAIFIAAENPVESSKITDSNFVNNKVHNGGAVYLHSDKVTIKGSTFSANFAFNDGAGIYVAGNYCNLDNSTFTDNIAGDDGSAVYWEGNLEIISAISCLGNRGISEIDPKDHVRSSSKGGTICLRGSNVTISKSNFSDSNCGYEGGAIHVDGAGTVVYNSEFSCCTAVNYGGALSIWGSNTKIVNNTFNQSKTTKFNGGAVFVNGEIQQF